MFYLDLTEIVNGAELSGTSAAPDPGGIRICWSGARVSCANLYDDDDARPDAVNASPAPYDPGDPWLARVDAEETVEGAEPSPEPSEAPEPPSNGDGQAAANEGDHSPPTV